MEHAYAVVMAGGSGTRFWPLSRSRRPKQVLPLLGGASLVRQTVDRLFPLLEPKRVFCVTAREHADLVRQELDVLPPEHVIDEPVGRDTAAAVGLAAVFLRWRDPRALFAVLPADHFIDDPARLQAALATGFAAAAEGALVTVGIRPRGPSTAYGYLQRGPQEGPVHRVLRFREKPDLETAKAYVAAGDYFWNGGIFVWSAETILAEIARQLPDLSAALKTVEAALGTSRLPAVLAEAYARLPRISIDYGVMEKASRVVMVEAGFEWDDVGSWAAAAGRRPRDAAGNALDGTVVAAETRGSLVLSRQPGHLVAVLGLEDMVVVHTPDATLVCPKSRADELKTLVEELRKQGHGTYL